MSEEKKPGYLSSVLDNRCPRCRTGKLFVNSNPYKLKSVVKMNKSCPVCGQPTEIEVGFYYGTAYVSYALTVAFCVTTFVAWWVLIGFSVQDGDYRLLYWGIINAVLLIVLQPVFMRLSRSLWLSWFVKYEPDWKNKPISSESVERVVPEQMNNW
ncbi:DUF983 domain-containing protein [Terrimonas sp.]|uniref:DUF983 domain-containing protein n=1 Tax=Terrimonas sp. TaxID=1914338 RepID=UPI00092B50DB|nr:DUF983 domain-containing protein [Terrimonas sp.]OJY81510.1 MAG: DUF983 domain-containing protein [Sphingobacteriales bacterium 40-81]PVD49982.1 DUF983 domain-containing protein [Terrimonas sp.]